jgi:hypothetical protein
MAPPINGWWHWSQNWSQPPSPGNTMIVTADNAGASPLIANRTAIGAWEEFTLITD